eukprot:6393555-Lingulodinium_polyedra.AAC.1
MDPGSIASSGTSSAPGSTLLRVRASASSSPVLPTSYRTPSTSRGRQGPRAFASSARTCRTLSTRSGCGLTSA